MQATYKSRLQAVRNTLSEVLKLAPHKFSPLLIYIFCSVGRECAIFHCMFRRSCQLYLLKLHSEHMPAGMNTTGHSRPLAP